MNEENIIAEDSAQTYVNRNYDEAPANVARHIKLAYIHGYTNGLLRAARLIKEMRGK